MITKREVQVLKKSILHYLTEDWNNHKRGKAHKQNVAIFSKDKGYQIFNDTDLEMVMEKVVNGLYSGMDKINNVGQGRKLFG